MKWFAGSINQAITTSKSERAVFVVFIEGKDDTSAQLAQAIDATEVSSRLEKEHFVAIRLESGSEAYRNFAQIYQLVPVPSLFFIGENGAPLEIVAGTTTVDDLASKIDNVLIRAGKVVQNVSLNFIDAEKEAVIASSSNSNNAVKVAASNISNSMTNSNTDSVTTESTTVNLSYNEKDAEDSIKSPLSTEPSSSTENKNSNETSETDAKNKQESQNNELTTEEKMERARQLIELQRKQRLEEEQKKEREREIERRKMGRDVQKLKQMQQDVEMKQAYEERMREKAAEAAALTRVKEQIAQDKLERKQKELMLQQQVQRQHQEQPKCSAVLSNATVTRIQFRLPSGSSHIGQFEPSSTLRALRTYVIENIEPPFRQFSMSTSFPRRELTNEENDKTLLELELVPSAVILILPLQNSVGTKMIASAQDSGFFSRFMWPLLTPVIGIYNFLSSIVGYFFGTNSDANSQYDNSDEDTETIGNTDRATSPNLQNITRSSGRYLGNQGRTSVRTQGNIHRLHTNGDDNDENNTWNGNSTQQM